MSKSLVLLVTCTMIMPSLKASDTSNPQDKHPARDSEMASTYVPLDSWVYSAFERLAAEGYVQTAFLSLRPWTRLDCARLIEEAEDHPFPLVYPTESVWLSGFLLGCVPHLPHLIIRGEGLLSPRRHLEAPGFFYYNSEYKSGYTNNRQLIGSWIGREAKGEQVWATWHFSPHSLLELSGRSQTVNREFLQGGDLRDLRVAAEIALHPEWQLRMEEQTEWWRFPLLSTSAQRNAEFTIQLSYRPLERAKQ